MKKLVTQSKDIIPGCEITYDAFVERMTEVIISG